MHGHENAAASLARVDPDTGQHVPPAGVEPGQRPVAQAEDLRVLRVQRGEGLVDMRR